MSPTAIDTLKQTFTGDIILPQDPSYEDARKTLVRTGSPAVVLEPRTADDVVAALAYARATGGTLSVRSGGHTGFSTNDGGIVIDVRALDMVEIIDKDKHTVRLGSGATWGDVAKELGNHGLALSSGDTKSVGVGGLTLGGGIGWMVRQYGLTIDSLVGAEVVTAGGSILTVNADEHADLFWGIRGGGGNLGIVTHFDFMAHPLGDVVAGSITYAMNDLAAVLKGWRDTMRKADEKLNSVLILFPGFGPDAPAAATIACCYTSNNEAEALQAIQPLLELGTIVKQDVKLMPYADALQEAHTPGGKHVVAKNAFMPTMTDQLIDDIVTAYGKDTKPILQIRSVNGAMNRIAPEATAFAHRGNEILLVGATFFPEDATPDAIQKGMEPWLALAKTGKGSYVNLLSEANEADLAAAYPTSTRERLVALKRTYDPDNLFRQNHNIQP